MNWVTSTVFWIVSLSFLSEVGIRCQNPVTTWTGAVSSAWATVGNWSNGVPSPTVDAVIAVAGFPCNASGSCGNLTVQAGAQMSIGANQSVLVHGNVLAAATVSGTGAIEPSTSFTGTNRTVTCMNGASVHDLRVSRVSSHLGTLHLVDLTVRNDLYVLSPMTVHLHGRTQVDGVFYVDSSGNGTGSVIADANGVLLAQTVNTTWPFFPPALTTVGTLVCSHTSSFVPTGGVILVTPSSPMSVRFTTGGQLAAVLIQPGASMTLTDDSFGGSSNYVAGIDCRGSLTIHNMESLLGTGPMTVSGQVSITWDNMPPYPVAPQQLTIAAGGTVSLTGHPSYGSLTSMLDLQGTTQVDGTLAIGVGGNVTNSGTLHVGTTGVLRMVGQAFALPSSPMVAKLIGGATDITGRFEARDYVVENPAPTGFRLLATAALGNAPEDLRYGTFLRSSSGPPGPLLEVGRTTATLLDGVVFDDLNAQPGIGVRATSAQPVVITNSWGSLSGPTFEDDPLGVVTWEPGLRYVGNGTPGCLPMAVCDANGPAQLGNSSFAFVCAHAHPNGGGLLVLATGDLPTPVLFGNLAVWVDPALVFMSIFGIADANGLITSPLAIPSDPYFLGVSLSAQYAVFELPGCSPLGLSASTAMRVEIIPNIP